MKTKKEDTKGSEKIILNFSEDDKKNIKNLFSINDSEFDDVVKFVIEDFNLINIIKELVTSNFNLGQKLFASFIMGHSAQFISSRLDLERYDITFEDDNGNIVDIGEPLRSHFQNLFLRPANLDFDKFEKDSFQFFENYDMIQDSENCKYHDIYFSLFCTKARVHIDSSDLKSAERILTVALDIAKDYEKNIGKRVYKAVLYYYFSIIYIIYGDIENAYLLMYNALKEDKIAHHIVNTNTQPYYFITLSDKVNMIIAKESAKFVDKSIDEYNTSRVGQLKLSKFRKVLERQDFLPSFHDKIAETFTIDFTFTIIRLKKSMEIDRALIKNHFGCRIYTDVIFKLCVLVENILKKSGKLKGDTLNPLLEDLSLNYGMCLNKRILYNFRNDYRKDFSGTVQKLLDSTYRFSEQQKQKINPITHIDEDMAILYALRNFGGHKLESQPIIYSRYDDICGRILHVLFFSIEYLY